MCTEGDTGRSQKRDTPDPTPSRIDAATVYEQLFVPAEFQEWAPRLVAAARIQPGQQVLDVACGTGVLAREVARRTGPTGFVAGVDINPGMLAVAARAAADARLSIEWREARAEALPYADGFFEAVVSQFGLMLFSDRLGALREMQRVLTPDGQLAIAVWDTLDKTPAYAAVVESLERAAGAGAAEALRAPFSLGDRRTLGALFADAGMPMATITTHVGRARYPSVRTMLEAELRGWMPGIGIVFSDDQSERIIAEAERALSAYVTAEGGLTFDSPAHIVTATKS
jgi:SAM-dependent methyltransferase